jgi:hypothetical protein
MQVKDEMFQRMAVCSLIIEAEHFCQYSGRLSDKIGGGEACDVCWHYLISVHRYTPLNPIPACKIPTFHPSEIYCMLPHIEATPLA